MQTRLSLKSAILAAVLVALFVFSWELYLRHKGAIPDYDDNAELWAHTRAMVYEPSDKATVFIGSSRIKYDLDIPTWEGITHNHAIQLAMVGSSPRHMLTDLANDPNFKGKLVVDVTEVLFFSNRGNERPDQGINFYKKRTPAQKVSFILDKPVESRIAFLNEGEYSLNALLGKLHVKDRPGVYPFLDFPPGFEYTRFNRQTMMTPDFIADTNQINQVKGIWALLRQDRTPPMSGKPLDSVMLSVKADVNKIKARGGDVIFTRTPSSGWFWMAEQHGYPRKAYWDRLLTETGCKGVYFEDYPALAKLTCPELSHLTPGDAKIFTQNLITILEKEKGWSFSQTDKTATNLTHQNLSRHGF
ncbi:MAG: hypothetical protein JO080_16445 [Mucilaginibacter sp.]|nr:hypothetical protein [Mucilaginibacter sp.]